MTDNEKKMLNSISPFENSMMCAMIAGDTLEKIRGICKESFRMNDTGCEGLTSEQIFRAFRVAAALGDMDTEALLDSLGNAQMKEDCKDAIIVSMSGRNPAQMCALMLLLKGVIMPLTESLKAAEQTINNLVIATGKKEEAREQV